MACQGCARRRAKMLAAFNAARAGFASAKKSYAAQAVNIPYQKRKEPGEPKNIIEIQDR